MALLRAGQEGGCELNRGVLAGVTRLQVPASPPSSDLHLVFHRPCLPVTLLPAGEYVAVEKVEGIYKMNGAVEQVGWFNGVRRGNNNHLQRSQFSRLQCPHSCPCLRAHLPIKSHSHLLNPLAHLFPYAAFPPLPPPTDLGVRQLL